MCECVHSEINANGVSDVWKLLIERQKQSDDDFLFGFFEQFFICCLAAFLSAVVGGASFLHLLYKYIYLRLWKREPFVA